MTLLDRKLLTTLCALAFSAAPVFAQTTLYSDDFTGGTDGSLNGQAPQVRPGSETWKTGSTNKITADGGSVTGNGEMSAYLPMATIQADAVYTLTARAFNNFAENITSWVGLGWSAQTDTSNPSQGWNRPNTGAYWMLWRGNNEIRGWRGLGAINPIGATGVNAAGVANVLDLRVILDTRTDSNTVTFLYKNPDATEWSTYASATLESSTIASIKSVGFSTVTGSSAGIQSFDLTVDASAPSDPYLAWAGPGVPFGEDANGDGVSNGLAFLLGAESPSSTDAPGLLPKPTQDNGALTLGFQMRNAASRGTAKLNLQYSSDLGLADPWTTIAIPDSTPDPQSGDVTFTITPGTLPNTVTVSATIAASEANATGRLFARCSATE